MNVFELVALLTIDSSGFAKGLSSAQKSFLQFGGIAGNIATGVGKVVVDGLAQASSAAIDFGKSSVEAGMNFDASMSQVAATMGKTVDELENEVGHVETSFGSFNGTLREFAQYMGANTAFSASQAADALNYMALAGYNTQQSMEMLPNVLSLAAAGGMELATASDMVTDAQTALGLSFAETNIMVDQMAKTASTTNTSVAQLGDAILTIGGTAQYMAGGTEELAAVLGILADNGIKGSEAGTHLRNMLLKLSSPTKDGIMAIEELGLQVFDAEGKMRDFESIFTDLNTAMADFSEEKKIQTFSNLFNTRDVASATALLNTSAERWAEVKSAIEDADGAAAKMAETQLDNLAGDITIFKSALEGVQIVLSDQLTPTLREFVQMGTEGLQTITEGFKENGFEGALTNAVSFISENGGEIISKFGQIVPNVIKGVAELITKLVPKILTVVSTDIIPALLEALPPILTMIGEVGPQLILTIVNAILGALPSIVEVALVVITTLATGIAQAIPELIPTIIDVVVTIFNIIMENLPLIIDAAVDIINALIEGIYGALPELSIAVTTIMWKMLTSILYLLPQFILAGVEIIETLLSSMIACTFEFLSGDFWNSALNAIVHSFTDIDWDTIGFNMIDGVVQGFKKGWEKLKETATNMVNSLKDLFTKGFDIHSPSRVFENYGEMIDEGLAIGIDAGRSIKAMKDMSDNVSQSFTPSLAAAGIGGNIVIPVYIGNEEIQTIVVDALNIANYRSGGR